MRALFVPVFYPRSDTADASLSLEDARLLVREGHARWINRCRAIRLIKEGFDLRGLSCSLRPDIALGNSSEIKAAVNYWRISP